MFQSFYYVLDSMLLWGIEVDKTGGRFTIGRSWFEAEEELLEIVDYRICVELGTSIEELLKSEIHIFDDEIDKWLFITYQ